MKVPENIKVYNRKISTFWFDEAGIFCSISKQVPQQTLEEAKEWRKQY